MIIKKQIIVKIHPLIKIKLSNREKFTKRVQKYGFRRTRRSLLAWKSSARRLLFHFFPAYFYIFIFYLGGFSFRFGLVSARTPGPIVNLFLRNNFGGHPRLRAPDRQECHLAAVKRLITDDFIGQLTLRRESYKPLK